MRRISDAEVQDDGGCVVGERALCFAGLERDDRDRRRAEERERGAGAERVFHERA